MRVLFAAVTGHGHVNPLLPLADAMTRLGHEVTFATGEDMREHLARHGHEMVAAGLASDERRERLAHIRPADLNPGNSVAFAYGVLFPTVHAARMLPDLLSAVDAIRPDLLVSDSGELATPLVGALRGLPWAHHSYGILRPAFAWELAAEAMAPLWAARGLAVPDRAGMFDGAYLDVCPPALQSPEITTVARRHMIRPFSAAQPARTTGRPHVLITFGTVFNRGPALADLVQRVSTLPVDVTVTLGPGAADPIGGFAEQVRVIEYVPLADVLPSCDAVVTHGGSGTMLAALAHGVPLVVVPQGADHLLNGRRVADAGAGVCGTEVEDVPDQLDRVLTEHGYRQAASRIAAEIARMPDPAAVAADLAGADQRR
jgi:UDP:flavonoid glycosyltransferase YjiC (YdhE family)